MSTVKHGDDRRGAVEPLYGVWVCMKSRCRNVRDKRYHRYGGRGISVCEEWAKDYGAFKAWAIANGYAQGLQIDRIDNDGNYEPRNCRFVTNAVNGRNSSNAKITVFEAQQIRSLCESGETQTSVGRQFGLSQQQVSNIVNGLKWKQ